MVLLPTRSDDRRGLDDYGSCVEDRDGHVADVDTERVGVGHQWDETMRTRLDLDGGRESLAADVRDDAHEPVLGLGCLAIEPCCSVGHESREVETVEETAGAVAASIEPTLVRP